MSGTAPAWNEQLLLRHRLELVADAVARLDEGVPRRAAVDLLAHLADEDVDGAVAVRLAPAPNALQQLVARDHPAALQRERVQEPELRRREAGGVAARRLDDAPAVGLRDHQIEDADVRPLVAKAREALLALRHPEWVEARRRQVSRHALADDLVVLDDEHLGHLGATIMTAECLGGGPVVTIW